MSVKTKVLIGITTAETVSHETMSSIYNMVVPDDVETVLHIIHAYNVADGRNNLVDIMYAENCDYILFVDNDVILPPNTLVDLLGMQWYFCVGTYPRKEFKTIIDEDQYTTLYNHNERNKEIYCPTFMRLSSLPPNQLTQVDCCGLGCALIRKDLFNAIEKPYFFFAHEGDITKDDMSEYCIGEDMYFCRKVIKNGYQIWAHGNVLCGHIGNFIFQFNR